jgi:hypothetical protein
MNDDAIHIPVPVEVNTKIVRNLVMARRDVVASAKLLICTLSIGWQKL